MRVPKWIKWFFITTGTTIVIVSALGAFSLWYMHSGVFSTGSFDSGVWFAPVTNEKSASCYRGKMAKDIRDNVLSRNMTNNEVFNILGNPDGNSTIREYTYVLGMCSGFGMDYDFLHVYFDDTGHFSEAKIIQH